MSAIAGSIQPPPVQPMTGSFAGRIARSATDLAEKVTVTLDAFTPELEFGPCRWQARDETSLPGRGDRCLVTFDDGQEPWVTCWWPFNS